MTISSETVEVAARAMFAEEQCDKRQKQDVEANWFGRLDDRDRDEYRRLAAAVIASLQETMPEQDQLRRIPTYSTCATCDGGGCGDCS